MSRFLPLALALTAACSQPPAATGPKADDWQPVDAGSLSLRVPKGWVLEGPMKHDAQGVLVAGLHDARNAPVLPGVSPEAVGIVETPAPAELPPPREILRSDDRPEAIVGSPRELAVKGGRCVAYSKEWLKFPGCQGERCVVAQAVSKCRADSTRHLFDIQSILGHYDQKGRPDHKTVLYARSFERMLESVEFK